MNPTHLPHQFQLLGASFKGNMNQSVAETREVNVVFISDILLGYIQDQDIVIKCPKMIHFIVSLPIFNIYHR